MSGLLTELGKRLADRWLTELLIPGALFCLLLWTATTLRHGAALDWRRWDTAAEKSISSLSGAEAAARVLVLLVAAGLVGVVGRALAAVLRGVWFAPWLRVPLGWIVRARRAWAVWRGAPGYPVRYLPARPTWMGDRMRLLDERLDVQYGLRIGPLWSRLWVVLEDAERTPVTTAQADLVRASGQVVWGLAAMCLVWVWWPALLLGLCVSLLGIRRARAAVDNYAELVEALVDTSQRRIADLFGFALRDGTIHRDDARQYITDRLRKGA
ncbi:hypothetical protein [Embleya sp. NBC_00896]|uniref:hypothetical protein n=1 Tax=Embleya sp. NBC_00896 TaxID=2975961 RepID=UPI002F91A5BE|nr:hypothetical protein OG928_46315 [Embleya sp. NBC_00896]